MGLGMSWEFRPPKNGTGLGIVAIGVVIALLLFLLLLSSLSLQSFGVIIAAVAAVAAIILVAPATIALSAFDVALAVIATTFLAIEAALVFDCCVPLPLEEDHCLPPPSGKVRAWPSSPLFVDCRRRRRTTPPLPRHLPLSSFIVSFLIYSLSPLTYRGIGSPEMYFLFTA